MNRIFGLLLEWLRPKKVSEPVDPGLHFDCVLGDGSIIYPQARIINRSNYKESIRIGTHSHIVGHLTVWQNAGKIHVGNYCFIGENSRLFSASMIQIGNRVQIAHDCNIFDNNVHSLSPVERHLEFLSNTSGELIMKHDQRPKDVILEDDVWLGAGVIVLKGLTIGKAAVIGAGSVVTTNIPEYCVAVGNPARVIRKLDF